jgi:hypothetical protein
MIPVHELDTVAENKAVHPFVNQLEHAHGLDTVQGTIAHALTEAIATKTANEDIE